MSLQVWLPLTGDLHNQGLNGTTVTNNGATVNNNGKIGKCYSFNGTSNYLSIDPIITNGMSDWSFSCWVKINALPDNYYCLLSSRQGAQASGITIFLSSSKTFLIDCGRRWTTAAINDIVINTWMHITVTHSASIKKIYINGIEKESNTGIAASTTTNNNCMIIGAQQTTAAGTGTGTYLNGYLNDVRIYDHCLSDKEVEEIAKGLVLHYKLDGSSTPNPNLFKLNYIDQEWNICHPANYYAYGLALTEALELNQDYTVQLWDVDVAHSAKTAAQLGLRLYLGGGNNQLIGWSGTDYFTNGHADYLYGTFKKTSWTNTSQAENLWIQIYNSPSSADGTRNMHIGAWKIEKGTVPTPQNAFNENIIYDSSGYQRNGTIAGTLTVSGNTSKYKYSTIFDGNTAAIQTPNLKTMITDKTYTISCWTYKTQIGNKNYQTIYGGPSGFELEARSSSTTNPLFRIHNWGGGTTSYEFGQWYHFCFVHTDDNSKLYINGELKITGTSANIPSGNYFIGAWNTSSQQNYDGNMSDFRIYATALTEDQILELYHTSATIDNKGNVYAREVIE